MRPVRITATGAYLPPTVVTAAEIDARTGAEPGWTADKTGVLERRYITTETASEMAAAAVLDALEEAGLGLDDIDALVCCSATPEQPIPCTAALVLRALDRPEADISAFDLDATCLSFVVGLDLLSWAVAGGRWKRVVLVSSEIASCGLDVGHKESAALFGDGAAAAILERSPDGSSEGLITADQRMFPDGAELCQIPGGGTARHPNQPGLGPRDFQFQMHGPGLFMMAAEFLPPFVDSLFEGLDFGLADIDLVIPHQASLPALDLMRRRLGIAGDRYWLTAPEVGNTIAASIPLGLHKARRAGRIQAGDKVLLVGTSAGFGVGGAIIQF